MNASEPSVTSRTAARSSFASDAKWVVVLFAIAALGGGLLAQIVARNRTVQPTVSFAQVQEHVARGDCLIVDARDPAAFRAGHLPGAINLPAEGWTRNYGGMRLFLDRHRRGLAIVYCANRWCGQAEEVQQALIENGFRRVGLFPGGFDEWRDNGGSMAAP